MNPAIQSCAFTIPPLANAMGRDVPANGLGLSWQHALKHAQLAACFSQGVSARAGWQLLPPMGLGVEPPVLPRHETQSGSLRQSASESRHATHATYAASTALQDTATACGAARMPSALNDAFTTSAGGSGSANTSTPELASTAPHQGHRASGIPDAEAAPAAFSQRCPEGSEPRVLQALAAPPTASSRLQPAVSEPGAPCANAPAATRNAPALPPMRLHAEESAQGVRLWLALDAAWLPQSEAIASHLRRAVAAQGLRLLGLSCNGRPLATAQVPSIDKEDACPSAP